MAKDPYGNEIVDPWDQAIALGVMRSTWWSGGLALVLALMVGCCLPIGQLELISPSFATVPMLIFDFLSMAAGVNAAVRVFTMQPEYRRLVPSWHPWTALALGAVGFLISGIQMLWIALVMLILPSLAG